MTSGNYYFFCGIGGSGMLPLACIVRARGARVAGSDRSLDQGRIGDKFAFLAAQGIDLFPQDGSGIVSADQLLVTSAAVEESVPDVVAATRIGAARQTRPQLLAILFNAAAIGIAVGGTSGKSTVTGMIGWILHALGRRPTVMNGAVMRNFAGTDAPFASALVGDPDLFVSEVDESDGSIALYRPRVAVLNNVTLDHKAMDELRGLFAGFAAAAGMVVVNIDDPEARVLGDAVQAERRLTFGLDPAADIAAADIVEAPLSVAFALHAHGRALPVTLQVPGRHNVANALAALAAVSAIGVDLAEAAAAIGGYQGLRRRFEIVGTRGGVTVIDDFGHNPDKIAATLRTLHAFPGRLLVMFQPHGYGPLKVMGDALVDCFAAELAADDRLLIPDPVYFGGTVDRSVGSAQIASGIVARGRDARHVATREAIADMIVREARPGDRIVVMGARDDSLSAYARAILERLPG